MPSSLILPVAAGSLWAFILLPSTWRQEKCPPRDGDDALPGMGMGMIPFQESHPCGKHHSCGCIRSGKSIKQVTLSEMMKYIDFRAVVTQPPLVSIQLLSLKCEIATRRSLDSTWCLGGLGFRI